MTGYIYTLSNIGGIFYVGRTINMQFRLSSHKKFFGDDIIMELVEVVDFNDISILSGLERFWIEQFRQWGFDLLNKAGNISVMIPGIGKVKRECSLCKKPIKQYHKYKYVASKRVHINCNFPDSYVIPREFITPAYILKRKALKQ